MLCITVTLKIVIYTVDTVSCTLWLYVKTSVHWHRKPWRNDPIYFVLCVISALSQLTVQVSHRLCRWPQLVEAEARNRFWMQLSTGHWTLLSSRGVTSQHVMFLKKQSVIYVTFTCRGGKRGVKGSSCTGPRVIGGPEIAGRFGWFNSISMCVKKFISNETNYKLPLTNYK